MPFAGPNDKDLPGWLKRLPTAKRKKWVAVWNDEYQACLDDGGTASKCEAGAFKMANGAIAELHAGVNIVEARRAELVEAATLKTQAQRLMRDMTSILALRDVPAAVRKEIEDVRAIFKRTWADLADEANASDAEAQGSEEDEMELGKIAKVRGDAQALVDLIREATTKTEGGATYPASAFLVVEDPEAVGTWHMRVRDENGDLDPQLMGKAWAELHQAVGEHRRYEGPNRDEAIRKLRALYRSISRPVPGAPQEAMREWYGYGYGAEAPGYDVADVSARSFADLRARREAQDLAAMAEQLFYDFSSLVRGVWYAEDVTDKGDAILTLARELAGELNNLQNLTAAETAIPSKGEEPLGEGEPIDIEQLHEPYPNEHACRIRQPGEFQPDSFRRIKRGQHTGQGPRDGKQVSIIMGKLKGETAMTTQAYRFSTDTWTEAQAREFCKEEDGTFEASGNAEESDDELRHSIAEAEQADALGGDPISAEGGEPVENEQEDDMNGESVQEVRETLETEASALAQEVTIENETERLCESFERRPEPLEFRMLAEADTRREPLIAKVKLIRPGPGNKSDRHYYPTEMLKRDAEKFVGKKMYETDHRADEKSTRTWVSTILAVDEFDAEGAPLARVFVHHPDFAEHLRGLNEGKIVDKMECSILASGRVKEDVVDGESYRIVEAIEDVQSVDWVTRAGAGGQIVTLAEADTADTGHEADEPGQGGEPEAEPVTEPEAMTAEAVRAWLDEKANLPGAVIGLLAEREYPDAAALEGAVREIAEALARQFSSGKVTDNGPAKPTPVLSESERRAQFEAGVAAVNKKYLG
ncbi:MAG: hypothetical protein ABII76_18500 [Pseudomonadota bacterium]